MGVGTFIRGLWPIRNYYQRPPTIRLFFSRVVLDFARENPELLSYARVLERFGIYWHNKYLTDVSGKFATAQNKRYCKDLKILRSYDWTKLDQTDHLSAEVLEWYLDNECRKTPFLFHHYPVNQLVGAHTELPRFMITIHQINTKRDARHYIHRLRGFKKKIHQLILTLERKEKLGMVPPSYIIELVIDDLDKFLAEKIEENPLYTNLADRLAELPRVSERKRMRYLNEAKKNLSEVVYPAYEGLRMHFRRIRDLADERAGVWKLRRGDAYFKYMLRSHTTTGLTPDEVHQLGLQEVDRIQEEISAAFDKEGISLVNGSLSDTLRALSEDGNYLYPDTDEGRLQCLKDFETIVREAEEMAKGLFLQQPSLPCHVGRLPKYKEASSPEAYYEPPSYHGSRAGIFYVNLGNMRNIIRFGMRTLTYHETVPGHHFQVARQIELQGVPLFRRIIPFTAYVEGWALYAERLAWEQKWYYDRMDNIGRLQSELFRAVRLVVDTGIHAKKWRRKEAIEYMMAHTGTKRPAIQVEVDRYIVDPGQACSYKIGELKLLELRDRAQQELGDRFDIKQFHAAILNQGSVPLEVLDKVIEHHIRNQQHD